ncbi:EthD domain-containing protein [Mycolicibacillus parakoreensis]|uniref:EthD domain-containing protein n=1 Tax=Mycolicibacillus parakoreensis TaxID=1069221 RepID=A0ABY3U516_9MYCO|nr:EthD domain-containing protein [Mycolicibacillus parakoreensis]MCV7314460.1 EthD domain-containing protein [Mycolicibacillus parakoreensis]ULN53201.1 EthD domain-containing protein [Mycolicibacillus parakoreensis]
MEKVVIVARTTDFDDRWCARLRGPVATRLLDLELPGVAVNVRDEPVRDAMMTLTTLDPPVAAVISLWTQQHYGQQTRAAIALIEAESESAAAYLVTESTPMPPPDPGGGARTRGLANVALLRRPAGLDQPTWLHRWHVDHTPVALATQATFGYTQNVVVRALTADAPAIDGIVEESFPDAAVSDPHAFYGAANDAELADRVGRLLASVTAFGAHRDIDTVPTSRYVFRSPFLTCTAATG